MSAWYVFSALGLYPVNPVSGVFAIGSPQVKQAVIHLDAAHYQGKTFTVVAENNSPANVYIQSARLNDQSLNRARLTRQEITAGGKLTLIMGPQPSQWGTDASTRPPATLAERFN